MRHEVRGLTRQNELNLAARAFHGNSRARRVQLDNGCWLHFYLASYRHAVNRPYFNDRLLIHPDFDLLRDMRVG